MFTKLRSTAATSGAVLILSSWGLAPYALAASPEEIVGSEASYQPMQSITYQFGSKLMTGYFDRQAISCVLTLMITENSDPEQPLSVTPERVRLILQPGQIVGFDSEEGPSVNLTCEEDARSILVDVGGRDRLIAVQDGSLVERVAQPK